MKNFSIIVAIAKNNAIGKDNQLLWHLPDDLKRFKKFTTGHWVIMGKKTFKSLPKGPLPNRVNVVITDVPGEIINGCLTVYSIEEAIEKSPEHSENFIIGGGSVYRQFLPLANRLYLTIVNRDFDADTFFPEIDFKEWNEIVREEYKAGEQNPLDYTFMILERIPV